MIHTTLVTTCNYCRFTPHPNKWYVLMHTATSVSSLVAPHWSDHWRAHTTQRRRPGYGNHLTITHTLQTSIVMAPSSLTRLQQHRVGQHNYFLSTKVSIPSVGERLITYQSPPPTNPNHLAHGPHHMAIMVGTSFISPISGGRPVTYWLHKRTPLQHLLYPVYS